MKSLGCLIKYLTEYNCYLYKRQRRIDNPNLQEYILSGPHAKTLYHLRCERQLPYLFYKNSRVKIDLPIPYKYCLKQLESSMVF